MKAPAGARAATREVMIDDQRGRAAQRPPARPVHSHPDFTPYTIAPIQYARGASDTWIRMTEDLDFSRPDTNEVRMRTAILTSEGLSRPSAMRRFPD